MAGELKNWVALLGLGSGAAIAGSVHALETNPEADAAPIAAAPIAAASEALFEAADTKAGKLGLYVVINHEEQYSIWPKSRALPNGWSQVGSTKEAPAKAVARLVTRVSKTSLYVVINHEEQYSLWPAAKTVPKGWKAAGKTCKANACVAPLEAKLVNVKK
jgi:uncharacterized protein YbdZ (MbtH family)